jgi:hypothetical protein
MLALRCSGNPLLLWALVLLALMRWVGGAVVVHRPVPGRSTAGRSYHNLPLLCFLVGADHLISMMTLLTNSRNDPPMLSAMRSCSLVERSIIKWSFFLSSVSTWSDA